MIDYRSYEHFCFQNDATYEPLAIHEPNVYAEPNYGSNEPVRYYTGHKDHFKPNKLYTHFFYGLYKPNKFLYQKQVLYEPKNAL